MPRTRVDITRDLTYLTRPVSQPRRLAILLHGYQQTGATILKLLAACFDSDTTVIAPDGIWPVPFRRGDGYELGYAWYFFDPATAVYGVPMEPAVSVLQQLVASLEERDLPKLVVGYSQGGYLAHFLAKSLDRVTRVVGVNCRFRSEVLTDPLPFKLDAVMGLEDQAVDPDRARVCHQEIIARGNTGRFVAVPGATHLIDPPLKQALEGLLKED